ncbi:amidohydrolase [Marinobacterium arenosum]|uniref:amidohydrolase n=1 Tax=Marinobacterium arenosum TaxID=2862496 RepID=UPI001C94D5F2|nr:amidohydrolase family protein [Marinobacterium arenosum]MBY4675828.1 amidohydrolase family protein [Marinobacterium arenosum]
MLLQAAPELILHNARVLVLDQRFSEVQALAIEQGRIVATGRDRAVLALADEQTRIEDMQGRMLIPGLIDNHIQAVRAARLWRNQVRLDGITSYRQALERIADKAKTLPKGEWILTLGGFIERQFLDQPNGFRLGDLDRVAPDHPVYLQHLFDWGYVNSRALAAIGIDARVPNQRRSGLLLDDEGFPGGAVALQTQRRILAALPKPTDEQRLDSARQLMADLNRVGLTTVLDVGGADIQPRDYQPFQQLDQQGALPLRLYYLKPLVARSPGAGKQADLDWLNDWQPLSGSDYYRAIGVGEQLYLPERESVGRLAGSQHHAHEAFYRYARLLAELGIHLQLVAGTEHSLKIHLNQFERLAEEFDLRPLRWTFAYADGIGTELIGRLHKAGFNIAVHARPWLIGYRFHARFGSKAYQMTPLKALTEQKIDWGLGSDSPVVASYNPFHTLSWAVTGTMVDGTPISKQSVSRQQALIAHTRSNAWLLFAENRLGTLEPGKRADLVVLDRDYLKVPVEQIRDIRPWATMVDGRWVYRAQPAAGSNLAR